MKFTRKRILVIVIALVMGLLTFGIASYIAHSDAKSAPTPAPRVEKLQACGSSTETQACLASSLGTVWVSGGYLPQPTSGAWATCGWKRYLTVPYKHCQVLLQPTTVKNVWNDYKDIGPAYFAGAATALSMLCGLAGPQAAAMCGAFVAIQTGYTYFAFRDAANASPRRCVRFQWDEFPTLIFPMNMKVAPYGSAEKWLAAHINNSWGTDYGVVWGDPTRCGERNTPKCPISPGMDLLNTCLWI